LSFFASEPSGGEYGEEDEQKEHDGNEGEHALWNP
jgi:hypothetical protein